MIGFFPSNALPKVTAHTMADLPIVHVTDKRLSKNNALHRMAETLEAAVPYGRWVMVRKVSDLIKAHPEILVMRDTYGSNLMRVLCENPATFTNAVDIFFEGPLSIDNMFYEKDNFGSSPIMSIAQGLSLGNIYGDEESKKVFDAIVEKVREGGKHDVADVLLEIWGKNFYPSDTQCETQSDTQSDTPRG